MDNVDNEKAHLRNEVRFFCRNLGEPAHRTPRRWTRRWSLKKRARARVKSNHLRTLFLAFEFIEHLLHLWRNLLVFAFLVLLVFRINRLA